MSSGLGGRGGDGEDQDGIEAARRVKVACELYLHRRTAIMGQRGEAGVVNQLVDSCEGLCKAAASEE